MTKDFDELTSDIDKQFKANRKRMEANQKRIDEQVKQYDGGLTLIGWLLVLVPLLATLGGCGFVMWAVVKLMQFWGVA